MVLRSRERRIWLESWLQCLWASRNLLLIAVVLLWVLALAITQPLRHQLQQLFFNRKWVMVCAWGLKKKAQGAVNVTIHNNWHPYIGFDSAGTVAGNDTSETFQLQSNGVLRSTPTIGNTSAPNSDIAFGKWEGFGWTWQQSLHKSDTDLKLPCPDQTDDISVPTVLQASLKAGPSYLGYGVKRRLLLCAYARWCRGWHPIVAIVRP